MSKANVQITPPSGTPIPLHFDVSSGLKSVLGGELITNDEVAIFELVKNSFDASASRVDIYFDDETIVVADNGSGMTEEDIQKSGYSLLTPQSAFDKTFGTKYQTENATQEARELVDFRRTALER